MTNEISDKKQPLQIVFHIVNTVIKQNGLDVSFDSGCIVDPCRRYENKTCYLRLIGFVTHVLWVTIYYLFINPCAC